MLVRDMEETSEKHGKPPGERSLKELLELGIVVIDKPSGPTSHQVTAWVKQILGARKAGHSGTLDPKVTGVLPVTINSSTKIVPALLKAGKTYVGIMHLHGDVKESDVLKVAEEFKGEILQTPPVKSAVKRRARKRNVYSLKILEVEGREVLFRSSVEAGTYIRKLCHDMGVGLGAGANMKELRRIKAGPFGEEHLTTLHKLNEAWNHHKETGDEGLLRKLVRPVEEGVAALPKVSVKDSAVNSITYGANLGVAGIAQVDEGIEPGKLAALMTLKKELIAIGVARLSSEDMVKLWEGEAVNTSRVVMKQDVYPKTW